MKNSIAPCIVPALGCSVILVGLAIAVLGCSGAPVQPPLETQLGVDPTDDAGPVHPGVIPTPVPDSGDPTPDPTDDAGPITGKDASVPDTSVDSGGFVADSDSSAPPDTGTQADCASCVLGGTAPGCSTMPTSCPCSCYSQSSSANWPVVCVGSSSIGCTCTDDGTGGCIAPKQ